jgi:CRISPR system Cascade subunit CasE
VSEQRYFSRVRIDLAGLDRRELHRITSGDAYADHALVWRLFPSDADAKRDFIFRAERDAEGWPEYYVVSRREPQSVPGLLRVEVKPYAPCLEAGDRLHFRLRANPTEVTAESMSTGDLARYNARRAQAGLAQKPNRVRRQFHDVLMAAKRRHPLDENAPAELREARTRALDEAAKAWIFKRFAEAGLRPLARLARLSGRTEPAMDWTGYTQHRLDHRGRRIQFSSVDYEGMVEVEDAGKVQVALTDGMGRAKAFGCGLLLVRRAP